MTGAVRSGASPTRFRDLTHGGDWLLGTLGHELVDTFAGRRWLLLPVAALKLGFAALPILLAASGRLGDRTWRPLCWLGAVVLLVWGGVNTLTGNLVLVGVLHPDGGYDHDGMVGHAWLWDPLFLAWGVALAAALLLVPRQPRGVPARHDTATS